MEISKVPDFSRIDRNNFPDWQFSEAYKSQGDVFKILPAPDFVHFDKVKKLMKNKRKFENKYRYTEIFDSLKEES